MKLSLLFLASLSAVQGLQQQNVASAGRFRRDPMPGDERTVDENAEAKKSEGENAESEQPKTENTEVKKTEGENAEAEQPKTEKTETEKPKADGSEPKPKPEKNNDKSSSAALTGTILLLAGTRFL